MKSNTYFALTIGPIYDTLRQARKTRELWSASFLFSWIMKHLCKNLKSNFYSHIEFILPVVPDSDLNATGQYGEGLYPDWIIARISLDITEAEKTWIKVISDTIKDCEKSTDLKLLNYIQIYSCRMEVGDGKNPILEITPVLAQLDLHRKVPDTFPFDSDWWPEERGPLYKHLNNSKLVSDGFGEHATIKFQSIPEISLGSFYPDRATDDSRDDSAIYSEAKNIYKESLKKYHKYIAIVHADGDGIGETLKRLVHFKDIQDFSERLYNFSKTAVKNIHEFGGQPVYAGGDDLLFFAPLVTNTNGKTDHLVDFLSRLANEFKEQFSGMQAPPTLSFGVSVTYYKYPLNLALEASREQLFGHAKSFPGKNVLRLETRLHSISGFGFYLPMNADIPWVKPAEDLLNSAFLSSNEMTGMVTAVRQKTVDYQPVFEPIIHQPERLRQSFQNFIGKGSDTNPLEKAFYSDSARLFCEMAADYCRKYHDLSDQEITRLLIENYFGMLKFIHFLMQDYTDDGN